MILILQISFLNNWFTWNPRADTFTVCVWIFPQSVDGDFGLFSTNCYFDTEVTTVCFKRSWEVAYSINDVI
jgi:hypothetical protein